MKRRRIRSKTLSVLIALTMVIGLMAGIATEKTITAQALGECAEVTSGDASIVQYADFGTALTNWTEGTTLKLLDNVSINSTISVTSSRTLDLNGYGLLETGNDVHVFSISNNAELTVIDSSPTSTNYVTLSDYRATAVSSNGTESINAGTGTLEISGGCIAGASVTGVGGGIYVTSGTLVMNGGTIIGNVASRGGGIYAGGGGTVKMNGGKVIYNSASRGGGIYVGGTLKVAGNPVVNNNGNNNIYLDANKIIAMDSTLASGADLNVSTATAADASGNAKIGYNFDKYSLKYVKSDYPGVRGVTYDDGYDSWVYNNGGIKQIKNADHVREAGTLWLSTAANTSDISTNVSGDAYYSVAYDANGATGGAVPTSVALYKSGDRVDICDNTGSLVKTDKTFMGWNTAANGSGTSYPEGGHFNISADTILYAKWAASASLRTIAFAGEGEVLKSLTGRDEYSAIRLTGGQQAKYDDQLEAIQLVQNQGDQKGGAFLNAPLVLSETSDGSYTPGFSIGFKVHAGASTNPADGFVFVIAKDATSIGNVGGGIGYSGIENSIGIEYDSYHNDWDLSDLPHTGIFKNGNNDVSGSNPDKLAGETSLSSVFTNTAAHDVYCWVDYNASSNALEVRYNNNATRPVDATLSANVDVANILGSGTCRIGFTSATGGCMQQISVKGLYYDDKYNPIDLTGTTTYLSSLKKIVYDLDGGTASNLGAYVEGTSAFTLNNPTRDGYTFTGWTGSNGNTPQTSVSITTATRGNLHYTAHWVEGTVAPSGPSSPSYSNYTITYLGNGGTGTMYPQSSYGSTVLNANSYTRKGYVFTGWNTSADGRGRAYSDRDFIILSSNMVLYAQWKVDDGSTASKDASANADASKDASKNAEASKDASANADASKDASKDAGNNPDASKDADNNPDASKDADNNPDASKDANDPDDPINKGDNSPMTENGKTTYENQLSINSGLKVTQTKSKITVKWGKVTGADRYIVYAEYCGKFNYEKNKTVDSNNVLKATITKLHKKKLNLKKNYKIYVVAYKKVNGEYKELCKTITAHIIGRKNNKNTNVKDIQLTKTSATLSVDGTTTIKGKVILVNPKKKMLSDAHAPTFRYASDNKAVASVDSDGKVTANKTGTCNIYVYAKNGYAKKFKVTVK